MPDRRLFDRIVIVDWSAASTPRRGADSIWMATVDRDGCRVENLPTRRAAEGRLAGLLDDADGARTLLGVDFSLGYPAGTAAALGLAGVPWRSMWTLLEAAIDDDDRNRNNRFQVAANLNGRLSGGPGPFWGRPAGRRLDSLTPTKVDGDRLPEWRAVEVALRSGGWRPFSAWQLLGAGCVGSQSLVGIPVAERLRRLLADRVHVWPFTTGPTAPAPQPGEVVIAEVWPSLVEHGTSRHEIRDAAQVDVLADHLIDLDRRGELGAAFTPDLDRAAARSVVAEEGWILGAPVLAAAGRPTVAAGIG